MGYSGKKKKIYQNTWMQNRRAQWIEANGSRCKKCGSTESLEVDHVDRKKKNYNPARIWSLSNTKRATELRKCQVLCRACHREKTTLEQRVGHGATRYRNGCRCDICRAAQRERCYEYNHPELNF